MTENKKRLLLHACCAPCSTAVLELLETGYTTVVYYYNPNISPRSEYIKRKNELEGFCAVKGCEFFEGDYDLKNWVARVKEHRLKGERSERCFECINYRLEASFAKASELAVSMVATTLSVSRHKDAEMINRAGMELSRKYGIGFLEADFKKGDGFRRSVELSARYNFYRQTWCGCVYSRIERRRRVSPPPQV